MRTYTYRSMAELARQLSIGLLRLRKGYIDAAENLANLVVPEKDYPYEFVVFRLTGYRHSPATVMEPLNGENLRQDLQTLILDMGDSFDYSVGLYDEPVYDIKSLAKHFNVASKTIQRWCRQGLVARRMLFPNGKRRTAFLQSSVDAFAARHPQQLTRSTQFRKLSAAEQRDIIRRAKRMANFCDCCLNDVARRIAAKTSRAIETIRYTIRNHDKAHPEEAIFPKLSDSLDHVTKRVIYHSFLHGVSVSVLAERFNRTRSSIYRVVNEMRARYLLSMELDCIYNEQFDDPEAVNEILGPVPPAETSGRTIRPPKDLPPYLASLYKVPLLTRQQEQHLFRKYNYLKYLADKLRKEIDLKHVRMSHVTRIESILTQIGAAKNYIIRANLRLVVSIARKHVFNGPQELFELISDGNISLMRAVEKFDYARGFKFSTYASWAIMKNFARSVPRELHRLGRFQTGQEDTIDVAAGLASYDPNKVSVPEIRESINAVLAQLSPRERAILIGHYGLNNHGESATLEELARAIGISKERVRQIEIHAIKKMREMLDQDRAILMRS
ncbi:MAG: sigma-70 family RNA polymerase sigma factor [Planctomycetes bacterium]|nr:sigma-70 family RNA polymerase sigma factor [Planctomycetota bacterium]